MTPLTSLALRWLPRTPWDTRLGAGAPLVAQGVTLWPPWASLALSWPPWTPGLVSGWLSRSEVRGPRCDGASLRGPLGVDTQGVAGAALAAAGCCWRRRTLDLEWRRPVASGRRRDTLDVAGAEPAAAGAELELRVGDDDCGCVGASLKDALGDALWASLALS